MGLSVVDELGEESVVVEAVKSGGIVGAGAFLKGAAALLLGDCTAKGSRCCCWWRSRRRLELVTGGVGGWAAQKSLRPEKGDVGEAVEGEVGSSSELQYLSRMSPK